MSWQIDDDFTDRPRFWYHVWMAVTYPVRLYRYRRFCAELHDQSANWRKNAFADQVLVRPGNLQVMVEVERETRILTDDSTTN